MNTKTLSLLAVATAIVAVIATFALQARDSATAAEGSAGKLFPNLVEKINEVERLEVRAAEANFTLERTDAGWGLAEKNGYPVDGSKVKKLLLALSDAVLLEKKTARPELYDKLGVQAPDAADSESSQVTLAAADGSVLADLIVGNRRAAQGSTPEPQFYVRKPAEAVSWLAEGELDVTAKDSEWLTKDLLDVSRERLRAARIEHADGETLFVYQPDQDATNWELEALPEGKELRYASAAGSLASALANLTMNDVVPAGDVELDAETATVSTFWTWDGLRVTVKTHTAMEEGEEDVPGAETLYASFEVSYDEAGPPGVPEVIEEEPAEDAEDEGADAVADVTEEDDGPTPEEVQGEAEEIAARTAGWVYVLPSWKKSTFAKRLDELIQDIPEPEPEASPIEFNPEYLERLEASEDPTFQETVENVKDVIEGLEEGDLEKAAEGHDHDHPHDTGGEAPDEGGGEKEGEGDGR